jgi:hypothetical protein
MNAIKDYDEMNAVGETALIDLIYAYNDYRLYTIPNYRGWNKTAALKKIEQIYSASSDIVRAEFKSLHCDSIGYELAAVFERLDMGISALLKMRA